MRELKFRAWDGCKMRSDFTMHSDGQIIMRSSVNAIGFDPVLMQFTGLTDAEGVGIYEGDVLKASFGIPPLVVKATVYFNDGKFMVLTSANPKTDSLCDFIKHLNNEAVIIGNIHENPEILEQAE